MTRIRLFSIAVVALVLLHVTTLGLLFFRKPPYPEDGKREGPKATIIDRLKFDADQVTAYEELIKNHRGKIDALEERMMELRGSLYSSHDGIVSDSLIQRIGETQSAIERVHAAHFTDVSMLCRSDQLPFYEDLAKDLAGYFRPGPPPPGDHR